MGKGKEGKRNSADRRARLMQVGGWSGDTRQGVRSVVLRPARPCSSASRVVLTAILGIRGCEHPTWQVRERQGKEVHTILSQSLVSEPELQAPWERSLGEWEGPQSMRLSQDPDEKEKIRIQDPLIPKGLCMGSSCFLKERQGDGHPVMRACERHRNALGMVQQ